MKSKKNGFTLLEVILTIMIMSIVFLVVSNVFSLTIRANRVANDEFDLQSNMRIVSESLNQTIKFSPAVFTLKKETFQAEKKPGWRYFGIEDENAPENTSGNKQVVEYIPIIESDIDGVITYKTEGETHTRKILLDEPDGTKFNLYFQKDITAENGKLLEFVIEGVQDNNIQRKMTVKTQLQALNAMVVEHAGDPAVAIAYKEEVPGKRVKGTQDVYAAITLALDFSGSMNDLMEDENGDRKKRIDILKMQTEALIQKLAAAGDNIYINVVPYSSNAKTTDTSFTKANELNIDDKVSSWTANGGTNTGEAMAVAYERLYNKPGIPEGVKVNHYNIILTDGEPTFYTWYELEGDTTGPYSIYPQQDENGWVYDPVDYTKWESYIIGYNIFGWPIYRWRQVDYTEYYYFRNKIENVYPGVNYQRNNENDLVLGKKYVEYIGKDIIFLSSLGIKSYVIGFGDVNEGKAKNIAFHCVGFNGTADDPRNIDGKKAFYKAKNATELDIVYSELTEMIKGDMWHVMGPY